MSKFQVIDTFQLPDRRLFVLAGLVVEGEIRKGMFVHIRLNSALPMATRIHSIEFARRTGADEYVCLCIELEADESEIRLALKLGDELLDVTDEGSE